MAKAAMDLDRTREEMQKHGLDALIATNEHNIYWASGKPPKSPPEGDKPVYVVIPVDPALESAMVISEFDAIVAKSKDLPIKDMRVYTGWQEIKSVDEIREGKARRVAKPYQHDHKISQRLLSDILKDKGLQNGTIGIEGRFMISHVVYSMLVENNPKAKFVDAEEIFWDLRSIKTEDEIKAIKAATALALKGFWGMLSGGIIGKTLIDLQRRFRDTVFREVSDSDLMGLVWRNQFMSAGDPIAGRFTPEHRIKEGEIIFWDGGVVLNHYNSDFGRVFSAGKTGPLERKLYYAMKAGFEAGLELVRPGTKMCELWQAVHEGVRRAGFDWFFRGHCGHTIGTGPPGEQPPFISEHNETVLKPNMVICLECPLHVRGLGGFHMEDEFLIIPDGYELLTPITRELVEVY